jgi:hypothetical protein
VSPPSSMNNLSKRTNSSQHEHRNHCSSQVHRSTHRRQRYLLYVPSLSTPPPPQGSFAQTLIWTVTGAGIGITAASIATLRSLFKSFHIPGFSASGSRSRSKPRNGYHQSYDLGYIQNGRDNTTKTTAHTRALSEGNTSQESILDHADGDGKGGISKRMDVEVTYEPAGGKVINMER